MKYILSVIFILVMLISVNSVAIKIPELKTEEYFFLELEVKTENTERPVTNFEIELIKGNKLTFTVVSDSDGIIRILFNDNFRKKFCDSISYETKSGIRTKTNHKTINPESAEIPPKVNNNFIFGDMRTPAKLKEDFMERNESRLGNLPSAFIAHSINPEKEPGFLFTFSEQESKPELFILTHQLKMELDIDILKSVTGISLPKGVDLDDTEKIYIHPNLRKKDSTIEITWLDTNEYKRIARKEFELFYSPKDEKTAFNLLQIIEKTEIFFSRILKDDLKRSRFILMPEAELKKNFFLIGKDTEMIAPIAWVDNIVLKVAGMNGEKISYFMIFSYMLSSSINDIKFFETEHPKWSSIGLMTYLNLKG
ncbi:MAG TPA: hypothetical protein ENN73_04760, partial [Firmicutes bacterium]|nr:hypothetical protein [Bacillota bacterium]